MGALCAGRHDVGLKQLEVELDEQIRVDFVIFRRDFYGFLWISMDFLCFPALDTLCWAL